MKSCKRCKRQKPADEFPRDTRFGLAYRRPTCKDCNGPAPKALMREESCPR